MKEPVERVTQTYGLSALWHEMEEERRRRYLSASPDGRRIPIRHALPEYSFDQFARRAAAAVAGVWGAVQQLKSAAEDLQSDLSPLRKRLVRTTDARAVTALADDGAELQTYSVRIDSIAQKQVNRSLWLRRSEEFAWAGEMQALTLLTEHAAKRLELSFMPGESNETALGRIRRAVNISDSGVTAQVVPERGTDRIRLEIASLHTGTSHAFALSDSNGWLEASLDLAEAKQPPLNTVFSVNGGTVVSIPGTGLTLDQGRLKLVLNDVPEGPVTVSVLPVLDSFKDEAGRLLAHYNALTRCIAEARDLLDPSIEAAMMQAAPAEELLGLGIAGAEEGSLLLDEPLLLKQLEDDFDGWLGRFSGEEGWTHRLVRMTGHLMKLHAADFLNTGHDAYRSLTTYAYGPGDTFRTHLPVPIHGFLMNTYG
ncbi:hypothetical protein O9H85_14630 [Paenibacillus filicis]|uniref:Flagellar hook-associated protein 2 N-terminal domain-containing protein n=1 Tax=Paenibacillus gyeongsangnamensis TaxID=3388067 RepID=A0ABT4Q9W9_9BACL|nr:flagellar cap protein FliD N-terminal domain-containing protein [Paenibacillus filicis]MCZ8513650.1 hypothetical protein [Paenibacillus filicis]